MSKKHEKIIDFNRDDLIAELIKESKAINIRSDAAKSIANLVANDVEKWLSTRTMITEQDYKRVVYKKLLKYNSDLAYIYLNRDKII